MKEASYHLTLLCQNRTGFKNLIKMASAAYLEGFYFKPRIDKELLEQHHEGIICLSGCVSSEFNRACCGGMAARSIWPKRWRSRRGSRSCLASGTSSRS
jgi:DNA polymerase III subunit alpha